ncbi:MAG: hypothetical protein E6K53_13990 [Gammaproteobacteria bacterium]|nr:MAG: hypothetical protein E6K53_13990 [Gammaproteobacteria bacterium]
MKINGSAIYASRAIAPYRDGKLRYTALKDGSVNAIYLVDEKETLPQQIALHGIAPAAGAHLRVLGDDGTLVWRRDAQGAMIELPATLREKLSGQYAFTIRISAIAR